jgi:hypothetical protein
MNLVQTNRHPVDRLADIRHQMEMLRSEENTIRDQLIRKGIVPIGEYGRVVMLKVPSGHYERDSVMQEHVDQPLPAPRSDPLISIEVQTNEPEAAAYVVAQLNRQTG